jgi:hypothetical protein
VPPHNRAVQLIQPSLLEEGRGECSESLAPALVLPSQEVHQLGVGLGVHLLEMPVGVADAEVLAPAPQDRVQRPNLVYVPCPFTGDFAGRRYDGADHRQRVFSGFGVR